MNKLVGLSFFQQDKDMCDKCGMEKNENQNGCCKNVKTKVKNENDQFKSFVSILFEKKELQHNRDFIVYEPELKILFSEKYVADHGPPCLTTVPLFILNGVFLI
jgi:predicted amidophosphoribosyltransferase